MILAQLILALYYAVQIYTYIFIARILLSWAPMIGWNINWYQQPFKFLDDMTEPVMRPFRGLIPPIGMLDISPIILFLLLGLLQNLLGELYYTVAARGL